MLYDVSIVQGYSATIGYRSYLRIYLLHECWESHQSSEGKLDVLILPPQHNFLKKERCSGSKCAAGNWQSKSWAMLPPSDWKRHFALVRIRLKSQCGFFSLLPGVATAIEIAEIFQVLVQSREPNLKQLAHLRLGARFRHLHTNEACGIHSSKSPRHVYGAVRIHCAGHLLCGAQLMSAHYVAHRLMGGVLLRLTVGQGRSIDGTLNKSYTRLGH